ncbi:MAG: tetraacyldisaccharide 4'-kinase [bacterium]|nr:tetraacyldisaccharide 4'-kinase [bacterium]
MKSIRWALLPFALLYGAVVGIRNWLFNIGVKKSYPIPGKSITVGNLSVGGTGKSPFVAYLIEHFLREEIPVSTLSRGYGRKTKGLITADQHASAESIGDEPLQYYRRYADKINVHVSEDRKLGVDHIRNTEDASTVVVLDDAFQHRKVKAGLNILITEFNRPYSSDFLLPVGRLRESKSGANRADVIIVSKCPNNITSQQQNELTNSLAKTDQPVFFSSIKYADLEQISGETPTEIKNVLLVTGIGNPEPLLKHLESHYNVIHLKFPDHHAFTRADIHKIHQKFNTFASRDKIIVTTEKDYMRLQQFDAVRDGSAPWFYQPISIAIKEETKLKNLLNKYVSKN